MYQKCSGRISRLLIHLIFLYLWDSYAQYTSAKTKVEEIK